MHIKINDIIGPWKVHKIINVVCDRCIVDVVIDKTLNDQLNDINKIWTMKINNYSDEEINNIKNYELNKCKYSMQYPIDDNYFSGKINKYNWFVMEKFEFDCNELSYFNYKYFLDYVINFLRYIHREKKVVHGDLKSKNILYNKDNIRYVVCDFETLQKPNKEDICNGEHYNDYYYYLYGCELNQCIYSYRNDLQSICYILWMVLRENKYMNYQTRSQNYYNYHIKENKMYKLELLRSQEIMPPVIKKFYDIISIVKWDQEEPPDNELYDNLIKLDL